MVVVEMKTFIRHLDNGKRYVYTSYTSDSTQNTNCMKAAQKLQVADIKFLYTDPRSDAAHGLGYF